jgi:hypothetical protein
MARQEFYQCATDQQERNALAFDGSISDEGKAFYNLTLGVYFINILQA